MQHINNLDWPVSRLIEQFKAGEIQVPEIQREVVWDASQVKALIDSIYYDYPCGSLILWEPPGKAERYLRNIIKPERVKIFKRLPKYFLIDGQQRLSALASITLEPAFLKNLEEDEAEYKYSSFYINLDQLSKQNEVIEVEESTDGGKYPWPWMLINDLFNNSFLNNTNYKKLTDEKKSKIECFHKQIERYEFPVQIISEREYATVSKIFTRVNWQGTTLTGAEIRMAEIVPYWPGVAREFRSYLNDLKNENYSMDIAFLLHCLAVTANGSTNVQKLTDKISSGSVTRLTLKRQWKECKKSISKVIKLLKSDALLDKSKYIMSRNSLVPLVYYTHRRGNRTLDRKSIFGFFYNSQIGSHYAGSTDTVLKRDIKCINEPSTVNEGMKELAKTAKQEAKQEYRGLRISVDAVAGLPSKNPLLLLMYSTMRKSGAKDFDLKKKANPLNEISPRKTHLHHIFPYDYMMNSPESKKYMDEHNLSLSNFRKQVNDIANLTFIGADANEKIKNTPPAQYLTTFTYKENLKAHCIPTNKEYWKIRNFDKFLLERKRLLADGMNKLLSKYR